MRTIGFIGGGRITKIFLQAFENNQTSFEQVNVFDPNPDALNTLQCKFPKIKTSSETVDNVAKSDLVFLAVHPPEMMEILPKIKDQLNQSSVLISLAPKITIDKISAALGGFLNIARMNPSASTIVNKGVNPIAFSTRMTADTKKTLLNFFQPFGYTPEVEESKIEAYAVISAMGHTYFFFQLQKLKELAVSFGMQEKEAQSALAEMLMGSTETLFESGMQYSEVADLVPVRPLAEVEATINGYYDQYLPAIFNKIKPV